MIITLNGEKKEVPDSITITALLEFLKIQHQRVAVELNMEIVKKEKFAATAIHEGDHLEVVSFMAGGSLKSGAQSSGLKVTIRSDGT
jgi:thiamine biosynthesis protein ThiS